MPKVSKDSATKVEDFGVAIDRTAELDGYLVNIVSIREGHSLAEMFKGVPGDSCWCPHWGYLTAGQLTVTYADGVEVYAAGDAFYMPPGHVPAATAGSEFVMFSPAGTMAEVMAAVMAKSGH